MTKEKLVAIMVAVLDMAWNRHETINETITKADQAWLRKCIRAAGYSLDEAKEIEVLFRKEM